MTKVLFNGSDGEMGQVLVPAIEAAGYELVEDLDESPDIVVDFTTPDEVVGNIIGALKVGATCIVGTTGWNPMSVEAQIVKFGRPVLYAPTFALGAVIMMKSAANASRHLPQAEIVEYLDPEQLETSSPTALATAARMHGDIPIRSEPEEGVLAHQEVTFTAENETLVIAHEATSPEACISGVLLALARTERLAPGLTIGLESLL